MHLFDVIAVAPSTRLLVNVCMFSQFWSFGYWYLVLICDLVIGIWDLRQAAIRQGTARRAPTLYPQT